ncbi:hypothetical protein [Nisaea sp.]|uniref:hypothetical protein n=1 Tax=Nisaea sp. TaxID=2024842 RepID=UPI002B27B13A|nr:hypothetical protein [Nisaea sp.]
MSKGSLHDSDSCLRTEFSHTEVISGDSQRERPVDSRGEPRISTDNEFGVLTKALKDWVDGPFDIQENRLQPSNKTPSSQALNTIEFEIFKITEMARRWIVENGLSPYKLALTTGTSPSQVHRIMEPGWTPSLKLARRIASSLPSDWVNSFELDCNACLPRLFHLHQPPENSSDPVTRLLSMVNGSDTDQILDNLVENRWSIRRYQYLSRTETAVSTANHNGSGFTESDYTPPAPRIAWSADAGSPKSPNRTLLLHRIPLKIAEKLNLYTIHIAEYSGLNWATQFWRIETSKGLTNLRQMDILKAYLAEKA